MWDAGLPFWVIGPVRILETGTAQVGKGVGEMKAPWEYFEDLHESVYVADCDTYELLYMNRFARAFSGLPLLHKRKPQGK